MSSRPRTRLLNVASSGGAVLTVRATCHCYRMDIRETPDPASPSTFAPQGLIYQLPDDTFAQSYALGPGEVKQLGDIDSGPSIGAPPINFPNAELTLGTPLIKVISATGTATKILVEEWS